MIKDTNNSAQQPVGQASSILYEYSLQSAKTKTPPQVIQELTGLLVQGRNTDNKTSKALEKIIFSTAGEKRFPEILSNCFYLILDSWSNNPESLSYLPQLREIPDLVSQSSSYDRRRKQLIQLTKDYLQSRSFFQLKTIMGIVEPQAVNNCVLANSAATNGASASSDSQNIITSSIGTYLPRYTYLYDYYLPQELELHNLKKFVQTVQENRYQNFEIQLSKHIIYRFRLKQVAKMKLLSQGTGKIITKVNNPTLLSERSFKTALQQYLGKVDSGSSILERSQRFVADNNARNSYLVFKQDLHRFLVSNIKPKNSNDNFAKNLQEKLEATFSQSDDKPLNSTLVLQTCRQLFSFFIADHNSTTDPNKLANLIASLGTAQAMTILIKIVLICPESKSDLEKKISLITTYHQSNIIQDIPWLFKTLEHLLMAFSIYFGKIDVSIARSVIG